MEKLERCSKCGCPGTIFAEKDAWDFDHVWIKCRCCNAYVVDKTFDGAISKWNNGDVNYGR